MLLVISLSQYVLSNTRQLAPAALAFITVTWDRVCRRTAVERRTKMVENRLSLIDFEHKYYYI